MLKLSNALLRAAAILFVLPFIVIGAGTAAAAPAQETVTLEISIRDHKFEPAELRAPAKRPIVLRIKNLDSTPAEFESVRLKVEKVIAGKGEATVNIRPQAPGRYEFFDDFHKETKGVLIVE